MELNKICTLKSGFQGKQSEGSKFKQIRLKDITKDGIIKYEKLDSFNSEKMNEKYLLKKGDVILKAKSGDNTAAIIDQDIEGVVATAHFIILTVNDLELLDPGYLNMYLNSEYAQDYFKKHAEGTTLPIVKIKTLEELDIKLISLDNQKELAETYKLIKEEKLTMEKLMGSRSKQFKAYLREVLG